MIFIDHGEELTSFMSEMWLNSVIATIYWPSYYITYMLLALQPTTSPVILFRDRLITRGDFFLVDPL